mmetsp:Transcript_6000/g.18066  ORF Transcript_6000/g.18066 Transcript_6000/m.18066 type:complete len:116 (+) Transcript_6000:1666-2013(+)
MNSPLLAREDPTSTRTEQRSSAGVKLDHFATLMSSAMMQEIVCYPTSFWRDGASETWCPVGQKTPQAGRTTESRRQSCGERTASICRLVLSLERPEECLPESELIRERLCVGHRK